MKKLILLLAMLLMACVTGKKEIIRDPIFHDQQNYIVFGGDGKEAYIMRDPIFADEQNYIIYREDRGKDYLMRDPIFEDEDNWILFQEQK